MNNDEVLKAELAKAVAECERLREENAQLRLRIGEDIEGIHQDVERPSSSGDEKARPSAAVTIDSLRSVKLSLFKDLFRGRDDVYAVRWEGRNGKTGYSPAGNKEWDKAPSSGRGPKKTCWFVAVDFDKKSWDVDARAFLKMCRETGVPASLERSRSGNGGHVWMFFANPIQAALARRLASALLTRTMERHYALGLDSYDRLFPSQDTLPKGGFGNLIALPLQRGAREKGNSVFVDDQLQPYNDQWAFLSSIKRLTKDEVQALVRKIYPTGDVVNVRHGKTDYDGSSAPWILPPSGQITEKFITEPLPPNVSIKLGNLIYLEKKDLPDAFLDRLIRLAAFQNPEFYRAQVMRLSTFDKPLDLFESHRLAVKVTDHRFGGVPVEVDFNGDARAAIAFEEARGCTVESVESDTRGFDLISRRVLSKTEGARVRRGSSR